MRWLDLVWALPVVIGLGCGNSVQTEPTANGGSGGTTSNGGSGGAGASAGAGGGMTGGGGGGVTTATMSTTSSTSSTTSTGSTTFADACEEACSKAGDCGLPADTCLQYLSCGSAQGDCAAGCINDPDIDCNDIINAVTTQQGPLIECVFGCQGGQGGAGGGGNGGAGGGSSQACQDCGQNQCQNAFFQCAQGGFQPCQDWLGCAQGCSDAACLDACTAMYPSAQVIQDCLCTSCADDCSAVCDGGGSGGGGQGGAGGGMVACQDCQTLAFQGGSNPCMGSDTLLQDVKDCICMGCANQCANECANPDINLGSASLQCQQCAGGQIQGACAAEWSLCQNDPN